MSRSRSPAHEPNGLIDASCPCAVIACCDLQLAVGAVEQRISLCHLGMRRRTAHSPIPELQRSDTVKHSRTQEKKIVKRGRVESLPKYLVGHPLFCFFLFLALFPGWALVSWCRQLCADGELPGCDYNNPRPFLIRSSPTFLPNWRPDGRCGSNFPAPSGHHYAICRPFAREHCCSQWGYCGKGPAYCAQAVTAPFNLTGTAFQKFKADFHQRRSGKPDTFQSAYDEAHKAITNNYTELKSSLQAEQLLTSHQQAIIKLAVTTIHKQLENFACCTTAPPFLVAPSGHWTQDSRSTADVLKQLVSMYSYGPDQQNDKPFWHRIFGFRRLLGSTPSPPATLSQHIGKGRFWASRSISPSLDVPAQPQHSTAGTAGRPTLKRQNAFKLSEDESQALTQQLGINTHGHSGSGHDLLSEASEGVTEEAAQSLHAGESNSKATVGLDGVLSSVGGSLKGALLGEATWGPYTRSTPGPDLHQPFNASAAYANITRCNTRRWVALHTSGTNFSQPRTTASGEIVYPPAGVTSGPSENQGYKSIPLTSFHGKMSDTEGQAQVLVVYHFYESLTTCEEDEEIQVIRSNLLTFLRFAVRERDGADYVISLGGRINSSLLDLIPAYCNVRVRFVENSTMHSDTCSFHRALLDFGPALLERYKYYVVINNGMRGPFAHAKQGHEEQHWTQPFIQKLDSHVKLVGPYLSCELQVHIQGPFLVTDRVGMRYLLDVWGGCWLDHQADIENGEVGLSQALLADGYNIASMQHEYAGLDFRRQPDRLQCKGRLPGSNPTFCCDVPDPLQLHWAKYGGAVYRLGLLPPTLIRMVEDMTARTMDLTPPLIPNGSHWRLPHANWVQQQQQAAHERIKRPSWWGELFRGPARLLGLVDDSLQGFDTPDAGLDADPDWTLVKRVAALLQSVPKATQHSANSFQCSDRDTDPGLMGWLSDAATKTVGSQPVAVVSSSPVVKAR